MGSGQFTIATAASRATAGTTAAGSTTTAHGRPTACGRRVTGQRPTSQKVIKDPAEYNAYITALNTTDPAAKAAAMEAFVTQYPNSIVKIDALEQAMAAYQQANNQQKVEAGCQADPDHRPQPCARPGHCGLS